MKNMKKKTVGKLADRKTDWRETRTKQKKQ